jgi:glycoprotein 3-alpha-L-fucosyltransferase
VYLYNISACFQFKILHSNSL